jgi:Spy/CpxP family protein refolding chaperone
MKKAIIKGFAVAVLLASFLLLTERVQAQMMGHEQMMGREGMEHGKGMPGYGRGYGYGSGPFDIDMLKDRLKLNDDQVSKLRKIRTDYQKEMIKRHASMQIAEMDLWEIIDNKNLDMAKAEKKVKELEGMKSDLMMYRIKALQDTRKFLTDEQYEQFRELGFRAMKHMAGGYGGMGGGMMGGGMMGPGGGMMGPMHDNDD